MMKCEEAAEWFGAYPDLPEQSPERLAVERHVATCRDCAEEFAIWQESALLIQELPNGGVDEDPPVSGEWVNQSVMNRIYKEQSWYMPAVQRTYSFSYGFQKRVAAVLAGLLALFAVGFLYTVMDRSNASEAGGALSSASHKVGGLYLDVPVASLSDPVLLHVSPGMPQYWVALSMLGMIMTLLILNWFSRVRS